MAREDVRVRDGREYDHYFPKAKLQTIVKKKGAKVEDTLKFIPALIRETAYQTRRFANEVIRADTIEQTCHNIWQFVFDHIAYKKDEDGKEQVRDPARTWHDRHNRDRDGRQGGVDCDCMTVFIVSVLYNLGIRKIFFRITRYEEEHFEHIYPVVVLPDGRQITIDAVVYQFDYETPYREKKDTPMDLEYLNGVNDSIVSKFSDAPDLMGVMDEQQALSALGKIFKRKPSAASPTSSGEGGAKKKGLFKKRSAEEKKERKDNRKKLIGKSLHVTNRVNPVTVALRNGVLAGMKLNFLQIGSNLRWTYLSDDEAEKRGFLMDRFRKLKKVREKLENIFYGAGGKPENLKKAILTGLGNRDKAMPLSGFGSIQAGQVEGLNEDMPLNQLLGSEIYRSENIDGLEGVAGLEGFNGSGDLGSATAASVAAASSALTAIALLIKQIGSIFPPKKNTAQGGTKKKREQKRTSSKQETAVKEATNSDGTTADQADNSENSPGQEDAPPSPEETAPVDPGESEGPSGEPATGDDPGSSDNTQSEGSSNPGDDESTNGAANTPGANPNTIKASVWEKAKAFWTANKKWLAPTSIALGTLAIATVIYKTYTHRKKSKLGLEGLKPKAKAKAGSTKNLLSGISSRKKSKTKPQVNRPGKKKRAFLL